MVSPPLSEALFPGFDHLYRLGSTGSTTAFIANVDLSIAEAFSLVRGELVIDEPILMRWYMGHHVPRISSGPHSQRQL
jgi:hypothetical protein